MNNFNIYCAIIFILMFKFCDEMDFLEVTRDYNKLFKLGNKKFLIIWTKIKIYYKQLLINEFYNLFIENIKLI